MQSTDQELLNFGRDSEDEMDSEEEGEEEEEREAAGAGEPAQLALYRLPAGSPGHVLLQQHCMLQAH